MWTDTDDIPAIEAVQAPAPSQNFWSIAGAGMTAEMVETDYFAARNRDFSARMGDIYSELEGILGGPDEMRQALTERGARPRQPRRGTTGYQWANRSDASQALLDLAAETEGYTGQTFGTVEEAWQATNDDLRAEWEDAQRALQMGADGGGFAEFLGRGAIASSDPVSLGLLPFGLGGSIARVGAAEAALSVLGEAAILPRMYGQAELLDIPDPDGPRQLRDAALFGGLFGSAIAALQRGVNYAQIRIQSGHETRPADLDAIDAENALSLSEEAGHPVWIDALRFARESEAGRSSEVTSRPSSSRAELDEEMARLEQEFPQLSQRFQFTQSIIDRGGIRWRRENGELTAAASELRARGFDQRSYPGLFRRDGMDELDGLVGSEIFEPGNVPMRVDDSGYLDTRDVYDALTQELNGTPFYRTQAERDASATIERLQEDVAFIREDLDRLHEADESRADVLDLSSVRFSTLAEEEFVSVDVDPLDRAERAERLVESINQEFGLALGPTQQLRAATHLAEHGGTLEAALERAIIDQLDPAGQQAFSLHAAPQRADSLVRPPTPAIRRHAQLAMLDDILSPEAQRRMDVQEQELRAALDEIGDLEVEFDGETISARQILDDLQADRDHLAVIEACGTGR